MLRAGYALVQATVGVGTVIIPYIGVAYTGGGGGTTLDNVSPHEPAPPSPCLMVHACGWAEVHFKRKLQNPISNNVSSEADALWDSHDTAHSRLFTRRPSDRCLSSWLCLQALLCAVDVKDAVSLVREWNHHPYNTQGEQHPRYPAGLVVGSDSETDDREQVPTHLYNRAGPGMQWRVWYPPWGGAGSWKGAGNRVATTASRLGGWCQCSAGMPWNTCKAPVATSLRIRAEDASPIGESRFLKLRGGGGKKARTNSVAASPHIQSRGIQGQRRNPYASGPRNFPFVVFL